MSSICKSMYNTIRNNPLKMPLLNFRQEAKFKISFNDKILKFKLNDDVNFFFSCKEMHKAERD